MRALRWICAAKDSGLRAASPSSSKLGSNDQPEEDPQRGQEPQSEDDEGDAHQVVVPPEAASWSRELVRASGPVGLPWVATWRATARCRWHWVVTRGWRLANRWRGPPARQERALRTRGTNRLRRWRGAGWHSGRGSNRPAWGVREAHVDAADVVLVIVSVHQCGSRCGGPPHGWQQIGRWGPLDLGARRLLGGGGQRSRGYRGQGSSRDLVARRGRPGHAWIDCTLERGRMVMNGRGGLIVVPGLRKRG